MRMRPSSSATGGIGMAPFKERLYLNESEAAAA